MARALSSAVSPDRLTVVVNVGDDDYMYGAHVAADLDTVTHTLAGIEGPQGWGLADDTFHVMEALSDLGDAQLREIRAIVDYQVAQIDLAFASGTLLGYSRVDLATLPLPLPDTVMP